MAARGTSECIKRTLTFVTGNPRKLEEVCVSVYLFYSIRSMAAQVIAIVGNSLKWELTSSKLDCEHCTTILLSNCSNCDCLSVPELQGEPDEIAKEKCRLAVEKVMSHLCMC